MKKTATFLLSFICVITLFNGCKNFLNGQDLFNQFEEAVSYVNQDPFTIRFTGNGGKISPSGDQYCRISEQISLIFNEDPEMCFLNWQVLLNGELLEPETAANYIWFENIESPDTKIKINARVENLVIQANVVKRPAIIKASPQSDESGVYRDRTIVIQFNQDIDENAIYFTADEFAELGVSTENAFAVGNGSNYYYAYWDGHNENTYTFKNITIANYQFLNVNYLKYFDAPKLDTGNKKILRIPTKIEFDATLQEYVSIAPPSATEILVTVSKNIYTKNGKKTVTLSDDYGWTYFTNSKIDMDAPEFIDTTNPQEAFVITVADEQHPGYSSSRPYSLTDPFNNNPLNITDIAGLNAKNKKLWVRGTVKDEGSGPASIRWSLYKVNSKYYPEAADIPVTNGQMDNMTVIGQKGSFNQQLDNTGTDVGGVPLEIPEIEAEGTYRIDFTVYDKNERSATKSFYFVYDVSNNSTINAEIKTNSKNSIYFKISNPSWDYGYSEYRQIQIPEGNKTVFEDNNYKNSSQIEYTVYDIYGNARTEKSDYNHTPTPGMIYYSDGFWGFDYDSQRTPIGIICDSTDLSKVRIWDLEELESNLYDWGNTNNSPVFSDTQNAQDGLAVYNYFELAFPNHTFDRTTSVWHYLKNVKNKNSTVTWYLPVNSEFGYVINSRDSIQATISLLSANNITAKLTNKSLMSAVVRDKSSYAVIKNLVDNNSVSTEWSYKDLKSYAAIHFMAQVDLSE